jgi:nicotinamide mononucleotide adenylyltransferase
MSPLVLITVPLLAVVMICFAYLSKSKERAAAHKMRMMAKYKDRARKLDRIIFGLPPNYLPKTLRVLIHACTLDSLRQMHTLSGRGDIEQQLASVKRTLATLANIEPKHDESATVSIAALRECKHLLQDLHSLIIEFHSDGTLDRDSAQTQLQEVRKAMLRVTLDTYKEAADTAISQNNGGLALHYCATALSRLNQDPSIQGLEKEKAYFTEQVRKFEQQIQSGAHNRKNQNAPEEAVLAEWQALEKPDDSWKKRRF